MSDLHRTALAMVAGAGLLRRTEHHYHRSEIVEKRAPTDESVALLREMEAAAEAKRISAMQMPGNSFHGVVEVTRSPSDCLLRARAIFDINGRRMKAEVSGDSYAPDPRELLVKLRDEMASKIAAELLTEATRGMKLFR